MTSGRVWQTRLAVLLLPVLLATACASGSTTADRVVVAEPVGNSQNPDQGGTGGELIPIQSDNVSFAGYDAATATMLVQFDGGALYAYYGVPLSLWNAFVAAQPHPWSAVGYPELEQGGYPYERLS